MKKITMSLEVFQDVPKGMAPKPTTVSLQVDPTLAWPNCMRVAMLYLASENAMFGDYTSFTEFKQQTETLRPIEQMAGEWTDQLDKKGNPWKVLSYCTASPKPVVDEPPYSICPRCGETLWGMPDGRNTRTLLGHYDANPTPVYCLKCGQRFKHDDDRLAYTAVANSVKWSKRIKRELDHLQPTLATVD